MDDQIRVLTPFCAKCDRLAAGFVRWPEHDYPSSRGPGWSQRCDQHIPWRDPDAVVVGIRHINVNQPATADQLPPPPDPDHHDRS